MSLTSLIPKKEWLLVMRFSPNCVTLINVIPISPEILD